MTFPAQRPRRLRSSENIRRMVRETVLSVDDLIYPVFVTHGKGVARPVESMPGIYNYSIDMLLKHLDVAARLKILATTSPFFTWSPTDTLISVICPEPG
jgi:porphobilinogen synthase